MNDSTWMRVHLSKLFSAAHHWLDDLRCSESGQGLVEYVLILTLVALVLVASLNLIAPIINNVLALVIAAL